MVVKLGDIHGNYSVLLTLLENIPEGSTVLQVGDFGAGLKIIDIENEWFEMIKETLEERDQRLFVVRGNHDDPSYFKGNYMFGRFNLVPDYHVENIEGQNYLFMGGAISIDRMKLIEGKDHWHDATFNLNMIIVERLRNINVVVSHNAPDFLHPILPTPIVLKHHHGDKDLKIPPDPTLLIDIKRERMHLTHAFKELKRNNPELIEYYYGHFHHSHVDYIEDVKFKLLAINESVV